MRVSRPVSYLRLLKFLLVIWVGFGVANLIQELPPKIVLAEFHDDSRHSPPIYPLNNASLEVNVSLEPFAVPNFTNTVFSAVKTWGGNGAFVSTNRLVRDDAGNLYVVGEFSKTVNFDPAGPNPSATVTSQNGTIDAFLVKFDANRNFQWVRTWGGAPVGTPKIACGDGRDSASGVGVDTTGNVYVAGLYQYRVDFGGGLVYTSNVPSHFTPCGTLLSWNNIYVASFSPSGTIRWAHTWGGTSGGEAYNLAIDKTNGYVYVQGDWSTNPNTGTVDFNQNDPALPDPHSNHGSYDAFLSKFDLNGNFVWAKTWGGPGYDDGDSVAVDGSGNIYSCGMYGSVDINFDPLGTDAGKGHGHYTPTVQTQYMNVFLVKFNPGGNFQWVRTWGGPNTTDAGGAVATDSAGNVYAGGRFNCTNCNFNGDPAGIPVMVSTNGDLDAFVSKYDASGNFLWKWTWGGSNKENTNGLVIDAANNVYIAGLASGTTDPVTWAFISGDALFAKLDSNGSMQWSKTWGGTGFDNVTGVALDTTGNVYLAGSFQNTVDFNPDSGLDNHTAIGTKDAFLIKFVAEWITDTVYLPFIKSK